MALSMATFDDPPETWAKSDTKTTVVIVQDSALMVAAVRWEGTNQHRTANTIVHRPPVISPAFSWN